MILNVIKKILPKNIKNFLREIYNISTNNYLTNNIQGTISDYLDLYENEIKKTYPKIDNFIAVKTIDLKFINELALLTQITIIN